MVCGLINPAPAQRPSQYRAGEPSSVSRRRDAKEGWFSSTGVFKFPYGSLANAQLFIFLVEKLVGVKIN